MTMTHGILITGVCAVLLTACGEQGHQPHGDCTSHYTLVANARTLPALEARLVRSLPGGRSTKVVGRHDGKQTTNLLDRRRHTLLQVDVWRVSAGLWTARQWEQCTD